jgi:catechol 2,3-dioxygenase-like lactoylglutathione lyase family enzyme
MALPADIDHLVFTCADLDAGIAWAERTFGVRPVRGGAHPQWGTHNALMSLGRERYLELLAPDPNAPSAGRANVAGRALFGMGVGPGASAGAVDGAAHETEAWLTAAPRLTTWMLHSRTIDPLLTAALHAGVDLGRVTAGSRMRADGTEISWEIAIPPARPLDGCVPWLIDWGWSAHPSIAAPQGARLDWMEIVHPDPARVRRALDAVNGRSLDVRQGSVPGIVVGVACPRGVVVV